MAVEAARSICMVADRIQYLMKEELGYLLHPCITPHDTKPVVCDMGTGTGLWLLDLADASPASSLHGFDIDISQAPPKEWLPATVTIDPLDIFESIPEHLVGKFEYDDTNAQSM